METEQHYLSQECEILAVKYAVNHFRHFLEGSQVLLRMDHDSLKLFRAKKEHPRRLLRFITDIEHYDPVITYRPGKLQTVSDALS